MNSAKRLKLDDNLEVKTVFKWEINDFINIKDKIIKSDQFSIVGHQELNFFVKCYPNGNKSYAKDYVSLYLCKSEDFPENVLKSIKYEFALINSNQDKFVKKIGSTPFNGESWGFFLFIKKNQFEDHIWNKLPDGKLMIQIELVVTTDKNTCNLIASKFQLAESMKIMLRDKQFCDVEFNVNGKKIKAHKNILAIRSSVFNSMFKNSMALNITDKIEISDIKEEVFEELISYIYTGEINKLDDLVTELVVAANTFKIEDLVLICEQKIISLISTENCINLLKLSDAISLHQLEQKLIPFIKENSDKIDESLFNDLQKENAILLLKLFKEFAYKN